MACIEKNQVCLSFTKEVLGTDVLHAHLEALRAVAKALCLAVAPARDEVRRDARGSVEPELRDRLVLEHDERM